MKLNDPVRYLGAGDRCFQIGRISKICHNLRLGLFTIYEASFPDGSSIEADETELMLALPVQFDWEERRAMKEKHITDIGDRSCSIRTVKGQGHEAHGELLVDGKVFDITGQCRTATLAEREVKHMVKRYRDALTQDTEWGEYLRDRFVD